MANSIAELTWIPHPFRDLNALPTELLMLLYDNLSAIFLSENPVAHKRAKHINIDHQALGDLHFQQTIALPMICF